MHPRATTVLALLMLLIAAPARGRAPIVGVAGPRGGLAATVARMLQDRGARIVRVAAPDGRLAPATGAAWPERIARASTERRPDAWVVVLGWDDDRDVMGPEGRVRWGAPTWPRHYRARVQQVRDACGPRPILWVGPPARRGDNRTLRQALVALLLADALATEPDGAPAVTLLPLYAWTSELDGRKAPTLRLPDGRTAPARGDGTTTLGRAADARVASAIVDWLERALHAAPVAASPGAR